MQKGLNIKKKNQDHVTINLRVITVEFEQEINSWVEKMRWA